MQLCQKQLAVYCSFLAFEIGTVNYIYVAPNNSFIFVLEQDSKAAPKPDTYSWLAVVSSVNNDQQSARDYLQRSRHLGESEMTPMRQDTELLWGIYFASNGRWTESTRSFLNSIEASISSGDVLNTEEAQILMAIVLALKGESQEGLKMLNQAYKSAHTRGDRFIQRYAGISHAWLLYNSGNSGCTSSLEDVALSAAEADDISTKLGFKTLKALFHIRKNEFNQAYYEAEGCLTIEQLYEPTLFQNYFPYAFLPSVYLAIYNSPTTWNEIGLTRKKLIEKIEKASQDLANFAQTFPFASAKATSWKATVQFLHGNKKKAELLWEEAEELAKKAEMPIDQAQILYEKAVFLNDQTELTRACQLLPKSITSHQHLDEVCFK